MHPLTRKITALQQRLVLRERIAAACRVAATVLASALLLGLLDYLVRFRDPGLQIMASAALAATASWAAYRWWYQPHRHRLVPLLVARRVESRFPQLDDKLASALEFLQQSEDDHSAGSAQLRRLVVAEAELAVENLPLEEVVDRRPLRRAAVWLAVPLLAMLVCVLLDARAVGTALARLAAPLGSVEWPRQHHLAFRDVPTRLAAGQPFEVELIDKSGQLPDEVRIEYRTDQHGRRSFASEPMTRTGDVMLARRGDVRQSFAFRAVGGDDYTMHWHQVAVVEPPQLESLQITVHPPAYTALAAGPAERHLQVLAGSGIEMHGVVSEPISAARILLDDADPIAATIGANAAGEPGRALHVAPAQWIARKSGPYRLELTDRDAAAVVVGQWNLRVESDPPPSVSWQQPSGDLFVTPTAVVPIELLVKDNLAIARVAIVYERTDRSQAELERQPAEPPISLYRGPERPPPALSDATQPTGESRVIEHQWDLASLELPAGAQVVLHVEATDYRPGVGRTIAPRRIEIITPPELESRFADQLVQIVRQLERALSSQRTTREDVRRLEIEQRDAKLGAADRNALEAAELNQRRVGRMLVEPAEGVPALVDAMAAEIAMNRISGGDLADLLDRLAADLERLASGPLDAAARELTAARKAAESPTALRNQSSPEALSSAGVAQDEVVATLERLVSELSNKADYRRFARLITELRQDQLAHQQVSRAEIGLATRPLRVEELTRAQRAHLNQAAAGQSALAARLEKIELAMDRLAAELDDDETQAAGTLADSVALVRRLAIGPDMQQTAQDFAANRVGQALDRQTAIADKLQQVLDILLRREENQPERLVGELREAEQRLAALREDFAALRRQLAQSEQESATAANERELEKLPQRQQALRSDTAQLARQLARLKAPDAAKSTQSAADRLEQSEPASKQQPTALQRVHQAEQDLEQAARQLAARRQQAEDDLALEFVRRFQAELGQMVERQKRVITRTAEIGTNRTPATPLDGKSRDAAIRLAAEERRLAEKAREHGELLFGLGAVRVSLEDAERRLAAAAAQLGKLNAGPSTQQAERHALARLEGMLQAFAQTASEAGQNPPPQQPAGAQAAGDSPPRRPTFELLEVKMLRMLQADLNERTADFRRRLGDLKRPPNEGQQAELNREARDLAAEQGRLAELVADMLARDNEQEAEED